MLLKSRLPLCLMHWLFAAMALCHLGCEAGVLSAAQAKYRPAGGDLSILKDATGSLAVEELERADVAARFVPLNGPLGYVKEVVWLRLRLQRLEDAPQRWSLEFSNPFVNDLRLYSRAATGYTVSQAGDQFPFAQRAFKFHYPVFALDFPDTREQTFYLRLDSDSSLSGELLVWQPSALREGAQYEIFYFGAVLGMICMSFLISIIHWLHNRERKILLFAILTVNAFFSVAAGLGLVAQFLTPTVPLVGDLMVPCLLVTSTILVGVVFGHALNLRTDFPRMNQFFKLAYALAVVALLTRCFNQYNVWGGPMLQIVYLVVVFCTGWVSWVRWRSHALGAGYFFSANVILLGSILTGRMVLLGLLPASNLSNLSWIPGVLAFIFLVHAGIFVDSQSVKRERDAAFSDAKAANQVLASERKLREEQTVFFSFVAHELRSPLAAIVTGVKNLESDLTGAPQQLPVRATRIKAYAERMGYLIDRHLTLQQLANADFQPQFSRVDPCHIAQEGLRRVQALYGARVFAFDCAQGLPAATLLDPELLLMALENLLINAAKYSPESAAIALDVFADEALHFRVSDRGPGIQAGQLERLLSIYSRVQPNDFKSGFGIGLAITQRVARVHGGRLEYAQRAGGGAVFTLILPLSPEPVERAA